jgi:hypothetical protein
MSQPIIDSLVAGVAELTTVIDSSNQLLDNLAVMLDAAVNSATPIADVQAIIDTLNAKKVEVSAAVVRNTR